VTLGEELLAQDRRERGELEPGLLRGQDLGVVLAVDVADHDRVRLPVQVLGREALEHGDAQGGQLLAHRGIDGGVRPADIVAGRTEEACHGAHTGAADPDEVNLHSRGNVYGEAPGVKTRPADFCDGVVHRGKLGYPTSGPMGDTSTPERRRHFRGKARAGRRIRVRYRRRGSESWEQAETRNIGVGGAFILGAALPAKTEIEVEIDISGRESPLRLGGEVRWSADGNGEDPLGVGVQFIDVDIDVLLELNSYLATLTGTDLAEP